MDSDADQRNLMVGVLRSYLDCYDLDLSAYDLVISTKNPTLMVQHPNHVCCRWRPDGVIEAYKNSFVPEAVGAH